MDNKTIATTGHYSFDNWESWTGTNKCPHCGGTDIEYNTRVVLTTHPAQSQLRCKKCGHIFSSGFAAESTGADTSHNTTHGTLTPMVRTVSGGTIHRRSTPFIPNESVPPYDGIMPSQHAYNYGWVCPKCGRCFAPHVDNCPYCQNTVDTVVTMGIVEVRSKA